MIVVSDNSPLQYLILIECIDALPVLYGQVLTTPQVIDELNQAQTPDVVRAWVQ
jgi:predicted nucleic acid-binding protein